MTMPLEDLEAEALQLPAMQRGRLADLLLASLEGAIDESPDAIAEAWDEEIARRVADVDAGRTHFIPAEGAMRQLAEHIRNRRP